MVDVYYYTAYASAAFSVQRHLQFYIYWKIGKRGFRSIHHTHTYNSIPPFTIAAAAPGKGHVKTSYMVHNTCAYNLKHTHAYGVASFVRCCT